ncbi:phage protein [Streptococcus pyogenes]|nr:phage protein [Streptococcus pyogenes]
MDARTGGNMTVKELIEKLQEYPDWLNVKLRLFDVDLLEATYESNNPRRDDVTSDKKEIINVDRTDLNELEISAEGY